MSSRFIENSKELCLRILALLSFEDIASFVSSNKSTCTLSHSKYLWLEKVENGDKQMVHELKKNSLSIEGSLEYYRSIAVNLEAMKKLDKCKWEDMKNGKTYSHSLVPMECHAGCMLNDRYLAIVQGWGPGWTNDIIIFDTCQLPNIIRVNCIPTDNMPDFRYSFTVCAASSDKLLLFGGFQNGGYSMDCNELYEIHIHPVSTHELTEEDAGMKFRCQYLAAPIERSSVTAMARGFHSAVIITASIGNTTTSNHRPPFSKHMIIWGGIHNRHVIRCLQSYNIEEKIWNNVSTVGAEPTPRFGHSCMSVPSANEFQSCLIFIGGSNGSDLHRNGVELKELHVLTRVAALDHPDTFVWSTPSASAPDTNRLPGRCHCAGSVGQKIITFGGSGNHTNAVSVIDCNTLDLESSRPTDVGSWDRIPQGTLTVTSPEIFGPIPAARSTAVGIVTGKWLLVHCGWNRDLNELQDVQLLDLTYSKFRQSSPSGRIASSDDPPQDQPLSVWDFLNLIAQSSYLNGGGSGRIAEQEDDDEDDDDDEEDDDNDDDNDEDNDEDYEDDEMYEDYESANEANVDESDDAADEGHESDEI